MGQAALKYDDFDELDQVPIPEGGIATFLTAETGSWADDDDDVPPKGITNVVKIADKLAEYGRNEDEYMVHAAEGETVIPMEVFKQNPALKDKLFAEMRIMGIEPERYIVGNELNSINPVTGQPEFFLKKLFRGLKKIVKAVLPVVATVALSLVPGIGPVAASAIVSGAQTAIQGGSLKDSLKAAAIGGISSFAGGQIANKAGWAADSAKRMMTQSAINTALSGGKPVDILKNAALAGVTTKGLDFLGDKLTQDPSQVVVEEGVTPAQQQADAALQRADTKASVTVPSVADTGAGAADFSVSGFQALGSSPTEAVVDATSGVPGGAIGAIGPGQASAMDPMTMLPIKSVQGQQEVGQQEVGQQEVGQQGASQQGASQQGAGTGAGAGAGQTLALSDLEVPGVGESIKTIFTGTGAPGGRLEALRDLFLPGIRKDEVRAFMEQQGTQNPTTAQVDAFIKTNLTEPNFLRRFGPAGAALMVASALGQKEVDPIDITDRTTGLDLIRENPEAYRIFDDDRTYIPPRFTITRAAGVDLGAPTFNPTPINLPPLGVAEGGEIMNFPRMNGPIEGPGTETSDDIPAMLSDGEFVFTAKAVRGAGKGSREDGMRNMYKMMRQFEARV